MNQSAQRSLISSSVGLLAFATMAHGQWSVISLDPGVSGNSYASGAAAGQQVGTVEVGSIVHAAHWSSTAASWIDLNPVGATQSQALSMDGGFQWGWTNHGGATHAARWSGNAGSWIDLHPTSPEVTSSSIQYSRSGMQVGTSISAGNFGSHASMWSGTAASFVDIHPESMAESWGIATDGVSQVGIAFDPSDGTGRASLWNGSAASWVNLNPLGAVESWGLATDGGLQFGWANFGGATLPSMWSGTAESWTSLAPAGSIGGNVNGARHGLQVGNLDGTAALWRGTAQSYVNLGAFAPNHFSTSNALDVWSDSNFIYVVGYGRNDLTGLDEALLWKSEVPSPSTLSVLIGAGFLSARRRR